MLSSIVIGVALGAATGWLGHRSGFLTPSGALSVFVACIATSALGGWVWGALVLVFVAGTNLLSRYRRADKRAISEGFCRRASRGWRQILGRVGWAMVLALLYRFMGRDACVFAAFPTNDCPINIR